MKEKQKNPEKGYTLPYIKAKFCCSMKTLTDCKACFDPTHTTKTAETKEKPKN
jgi:hypothetical protein